MRFKTVPIRLTDIKMVLDQYDADKGYFRFILDHSFIRALRKLYQEITSAHPFWEFEDDSLSLNDRFSLINILSEAYVEQGSASEKAYKDLCVKSDFEIVLSCLTLKETKLFNLKNFEALSDLNPRVILICLNSCGILTQNNFDIIVKHLKDYSGLIDQSIERPHLIATQLELLQKNRILDQETFDAAFNRFSSIRKISNFETLSESRILTKINFMEICQYSIDNEDYITKILISFYTAGIETQDNRHVVRLYSTSNSMEYLADILYHMSGNRILTQDNFNILFQHSNRIEVIHFALGRLPNCINQDLFNIVIQYMNSSIVDAIELLPLDLYYNNVNNFNLLCQHATNAVDTAEAWVELHRANLFDDVSRLAVCKYVGKAKKMAQIIIVLHQRGLLTQENYDILCSQVEFETALYFANVLDKLDNARLLNKDNRALMCQKIVYIKGLFDTFDVLMRANMFSQDNFNIVCSQPASAKEIAHALTSLRVTALLTQDNFKLSFEKFNFANSIRCAVGALTHSQLLTQDRFNFFCQNPKNALINAEELGGKFEIDDETARSFKQVRLAARVLAQGFRDSIFFNSRGFPQEVLVPIAANTKEPEALEIEAATEIAIQFFCKPQ